MAFVICEPCVDVKDTACVKVCPVDCIYEFEGERQLYIHPGECIDCGACQPECPVQAIFPVADVPAQWISYIEKNAKIFETRALTPKPSAPEPKSPAVGPEEASHLLPSEEIASLERLLRDVAAKKSSAQEALEPVIASLTKLGIRVV